MADERTVKYQRIKAAMESNVPKAIVAYHDQNNIGQTRKLLPLALGTSKSKEDDSDVEMVLCYQYDGYSGKPIEIPHPKLDENCRCFIVETLRDPLNPDDDDSVLAVDFEPINPPGPPDGPGWDPPELLHKELNKQSCIEDVEIPR